MAATAITFLLKSIFRGKRPNCMDSGDGTGRVGWECLQTVACLGDKTEMGDFKRALSSLGHVYCSAWTWPPSWAAHFVGVVYEQVSV